VTNSTKKWEHNVAFPCQQWLRERVTMLCLTWVAYIAFFPLMDNYT